MGLDRNGKYSAKGKTIVPFKNYITKKINENPTINRLLLYLTDTPLDKRGITPNGEIIDQPDINKSILAKNGEADKVLIPYAFNPSTVNEKKAYIFVSNEKNDFRYQLGENIVKVVIVVPTVYNRLSPYGDERIYKILDELSDMFSGTRIDEEFRGELGNIKTDITGVSYEDRLTKSDTLIMYTVYIGTKFYNERYSE